MHSTEWNCVFWKDLNSSDKSKTGSKRVRMWVCQLSKLELSRIKSWLALKKHLVFYFKQILSDLWVLSARRCCVRCWRIRYANRNALHCWEKILENDSFLGTRPQKQFLWVCTLINRGLNLPLPATCLHMVRARSLCPRDNDRYAHVCY